MTTAGGGVFFVRCRGPWFLHSQPGSVRLLLHEAAPAALCVAWNIYEKGKTNKLSVSKWPTLPRRCCYYWLSLAFLFLRSFFILNSSIWHMHLLKLLRGEMKLLHTYWTYIKGCLIFMKSLLKDVLSLHWDFYTYIKGKIPACHVKTLKCSLTFGFSKNVSVEGAKKKKKWYI